MHCVLGRTCDGPEIETDGADGGLALRAEETLRSPNPKFASRPLEPRSVAPKANRARIWYAVQELLYALSNAAPA